MIDNIGLLMLRIAHTGAAVRKCYIPMPILECFEKLMCFVIFALTVSGTYTIIHKLWHNVQ